MPTIVFVSPKGGAGKTTAALILALEIARGAPVTVIDADPNRPIKNWVGGADVSNLAVVTDADEALLVLGPGRLGTIFDEHESTLVTDVAQGAQFARLPGEMDGHDSAGFR